MRTQLEGYKCVVRTFVVSCDSYEYKKWKKKERGGGWFGRVGFLFVYLMT